LRPLAQDRLSDYWLLTEWERTGHLINDPEVALTNIRNLAQKLKTKGALSFRFADEEAKLSAQVAVLAQKRAKQENALAAKERPRWERAAAAAGKAIEAYHFDDAIHILETTGLKAGSLRAMREKELQRARWLADWKRKLINDINDTGYSGAVTDVHGLRHDGPVRLATEDSSKSQPPSFAPPVPTLPSGNGCVRFLLRRLANPRWRRTFP
jgi:hypothetical protein